MSMLNEVLQIAGRHHGVVSTRELRARGFSRGQISHLTARGHVRRIGRGTVVVSGYPATAHQRLMLAAIGCGGVVSHRSAAWLHGLGRWEPDPVEVLMTRRPARHPRVAPGGVRLHSTTWLPSDDITSVEAIPCTSVARTLLSLAGDPDESATVVRAAVDEAIRDGKASDRWLWWRLESIRRRGRPGIQLLESILVARDGGEVTESWLEREFLRVLADRGLPLPQCQRRVDLRGAFAARVDFAYERPKIAVEVNGHAFHSGADQLARDAHRRNELQLAGWRVLDFTYDQVVSEPATVADTVAAALQPASNPI